MKIWTAGCPIKWCNERRCCWCSCFFFFFFYVFFFRNHHTVSCYPLYCESIMCGFDVYVSLSCAIKKKERRIILIYRMVHGESNISPNLLNRLLAAGGAPVLLLLIFISQYVLKLDFTCPCSLTVGWKLAIIVVYLVLPCLTLMVVVFLKDHHFKKTIRHCCYSCECSPGLDF